MATLEPSARVPQAAPILERVEDLFDASNPARLKLISLLCTAVYSSGGVAATSTLMDGYLTVCGNSKPLLSQVFQTKFIDDKIPLHWALSNMRDSTYRPYESFFAALFGWTPRELSPIVRALLEGCAPVLSCEAKEEIELACCERDDNVLYQILQKHDLFCPPESRGLAEGFVVTSPPTLTRLDGFPEYEIHFKVPQFLDRMLGGEEIGAYQAIIKGTIYRFSFSSKGGNWVFTLEIVKRIASNPFWMSSITLAFNRASDNYSMEGYPVNSRPWGAALHQSIQLDGATINVDDLRKRTLYIGESRTLSGRIKMSGNTLNLSQILVS